MRNDGALTQRKLDGIYFRVNRSNKWENSKTQPEVLQKMCLRLADVIREIGDEFDIVHSGW